MLVVRFLLLLLVTIPPCDVLVLITGWLFTELLEGFPLFAVVASVTSSDVATCFTTVATCFTTPLTRDIRIPSATASEKYGIICQKTFGCCSDDDGDDEGDDDDDGPDGDDDDRVDAEHHDDGYKGSNVSLGFHLLVHPRPHPNLHHRHQYHHHGHHLNYSYPQPSYICVQYASCTHACMWSVV